MYLDHLWIVTVTAHYIHGLSGDEINSFCSMCHSMMGLTRRYKTADFFTLILFTEHCW